MAFIHVNGADLYYEEAGAGPPVLLIHGLGSSTRDWEYQVPALAREYRVIAFDVRGHGHSSQPPGPYSVSLFARDAVALLRALHAASAHVVGLSMGGMIAFQMAVDTPEAVNSLVIANSGPAMILQTFSQRAMIRMRFAIVRLFGMKALGRMVANPVFPEPGQEALRQRFMHSIASNNPRCYLDALRAINGWSVVHRIAGIACPVLIIGSDQDYTPVEWKREYAASIPGAEVVVLHDSRHVAPLDQPDQFNRAVLEFLASCRAAVS
jgi:3-oxoadipate enol-lactonase